MDEFAMDIGYATIGIMAIGLVAVVVKLWGDYKLTKERRDALRNMG